jgi:2-polyprenyl-6-methoxyphenol hydroxylase-like FAD-dependent oxidoreductase
MTPVLGQGGNQALETVAALTNSLIAALKRPNSNRLTVSEIDGIFAEVQELRAPRALTMMKESHQRQCMDGLETPELKEVMLHQFPQMAAEIVPAFWDATITPAVSIKTLPVPKRGRSVPFEDEIRAKL